MRTTVRWSTVPMRASAAAVAVVLGLVALQGSAGASSTLVHLAFDGAARPDGTPIATANNHGTASVRIDVASVDGGRVVSASPRPGAGGRAIRFPRFDPSAPAARAVLRIANPGSADPLDPGTGAVQFGADFRLDPTSAQAGSAVDDGNNLLQRGLWDDRSQLKLEVNAGRVVCRVKGRSGAVSITGSTVVTAGTWYRASCRRSGARVTLTVGSWSSAGAYAARSWTKEGTTGSLTPSAPSVPWSVGGKLRSNGSVYPATDQFNGVVDNVQVAHG